MNEFITAYVDMLKNYFNFKGTTNNRDFWMAVIVYFVIEVVLGILTIIPVLGIIFAIVSSLFGLANIIPLLAVLVRRLRDANIIH